MVIPVFVHMDTANDCFIRKSVEKVLITKIVISEFPRYNDFDDNWDTDAIGLPDIFPMIKDDNSTTLWSSKTSTVTDAIYNNSYEFNIVPALEITELETAYDFILYDNDGGNEYMVQRSANIYIASAGFPSVKSLGYQNDDFQKAIHLEYIFKK